MAEPKAGPQVPALAGKAGAKDAAKGAAVPAVSKPGAGAGAVARPGAALPAQVRRLLGLEVRTPLKDTGVLGVKIDPLELLLRTANVPPLAEVFKDFIVSQRDEQQGGGAWQRVYRIELPPGRDVQLPLKLLGGDVGLATDARGRPWLAVPIGVADYVRPQVQEYTAQESIAATNSGRSAAFLLEPKPGTAFAIPLPGGSGEIGIKVLGWKRMEVQGGA